jgi:serine/threonine protein kinase
MPVPTTAADLLRLLRRSGLVEGDRLDAYLRRTGPAPLPANPARLVCALVRDGLVTYFQAKQLARGKWRGFQVGSYRVLERLGSGGSANVFLCQHLTMGHHVAVKVLAGDGPSALARFHHEARLGAALLHPNIVRAYDVGCDGRLHFLVLDYVDGSNLRHVVQRYGPLDPPRAAQYVRQAALGLQHAHARGVVHRDVQPGNLVLDRHGVVRVLDWGLARILGEADTHGPGPAGTADYMAPEQARGGGVDGRADVYGLGATFYHLVTGRPPFAKAKALTQKLICHQAEAPRPVRELRPEVPEALAAVVERMLAKDVGRRYPSAAEVARALTDWARVPVAPPPGREMPRLSRAAWGQRAPEPLPARSILPEAGRGVRPTRLQLLVGAWPHTQAACPRPGSQDTEDGASETTK